MIAGMLAGKVNAGSRFEARPRESRLIIVLSCTYYLSARVQTGGVRFGDAVTIGGDTERIGVVMGVDYAGFPEKTVIKCTMRQISPPESCDT